MASEKLYRSEKLESQAIAIRIPADKFYEMHTNRPHQISMASPRIIKRIRLLEGQWGKVGSVSSWEFVLDGKIGSVKSMLEDTDYEKKMTIHKLVEGDLLKHYKSFRFKMQVTPNGEGSLVHWTLEYEKQNEAVPEPEAMIWCLLQYTQDIDAYLSKATKA